MSQYTAPWPAVTAGNDDWEKEEKETPAETSPPSTVNFDIMHTLPTKTPPTKKSEARHISLSEVQGLRTHLLGLKASGETQVTDPAGVSALVDQTLGVLDTLETNLSSQETLLRTFADREQTRYQKNLGYLREMKRLQGLQEIALSQGSQRLLEVFLSKMDKDSSSTEISIQDILEEEFERDFATYGFTPGALYRGYFTSIFYNVPVRVSQARATGMKPLLSREEAHRLKIKQFVPKKYSKVPGEFIDEVYQAHAMSPHPGKSTEPFMALGPPEIWKPQREKEEKEAGQKTYFPPPEEGGGGGGQFPPAGVLYSDLFHVVQKLYLPQSQQTKQVRILPFCEAFFPIENT